MAREKLFATEPSADVPSFLASFVQVNQTCIFTMGGSIASYHMFLPAVEAFNGSSWGSG